jgi:transcriptional regulator with XRE-family HTH domain
MPNISEQLIKLRKELRFSQKELANLVGIDQTMISDYERGKFIPTLKTINKFAKQGIVIDLDENQVAQMKDYPAREGTNEKEMIDISKQIIKLRENLGLNQSAFARKIGVSPTTLCEIESGKRDISHTTLRKVKEKVGVDFSNKLLSEVDVKAPTNNQIQNAARKLADKFDISWFNKDKEEMKKGKIRLIFNIEGKTFDFDYFAHKEENNLKNTSHTNTYSLIIDCRVHNLITFLAVKYPAQAKNTQIQNIKEISLSITSTKTEYLYLLTIKGDTVGMVKFKPSSFEDIFDEAKKEDKPLIPTPKLLQPELPKIDSTIEKDIVILCQKIIQIRDLFNELLEQAEAVVQPIVDKQLEDKTKKEQKKEESKVVEVIHKAYKQEVGTINYVEVGIVNDKNQLIFNIPLLTEAECKEKQKYQWKTYYLTFIYQTVWTYSNGETKAGQFKEFVPTNKIQEIESTDGRGVIGYVEHKAGIVEVIYYDRFVD